MQKFMCLIFLIVIARAYSLAIIEDEEGEGLEGLPNKNDSIVSGLRVADNQEVSFTLYVTCACGGGEKDITKPDLLAITFTCKDNKYPELARSKVLKDSYTGDLGYFDLTYHAGVKQLVYIQLWNDNGGTGNVKMYETKCFDPFNDSPKIYKNFAVKPCPSSTMCKKDGFAIQVIHPL